MLVAQAAKSSKAPASKQMKVACASKANAVMRYVSRASRCKSNEKVVNLDVDNPVDACVKLHGTRNGVRGSLGQLRAARRLPAGTVRLSPPADCPAKVQPNEVGIKMPGPKKQWYCGRSADGRLRWVSARSKCVGRELPIWVPQGSPARTPTDQPQSQTPGNKAPKGSDDSATTDKDAPVAINVLANDSDDDGDPLSVESVNTNGTTGTVTPNANGTITYDPAGKFDNLKPGQTAFDNFKYKVQDNHGGKSGEVRVDVTIKGKNLAPKAVNDSSSTDEETSANVSVLGNDTDAEGDSLSVGTIDDTGTAGDVSPGPGNTIAYDPNNQFEDLAVGETRQDTFKYRASDGSASSAPATVTMTVTGVNDAPTVDTTNSALAYTEGDGNKAVDGGVAIDDVDGDQLTGARVAISNNFASAEDELQFTNQNGISGTYDSGTGVLTLTGSASVANYQTALRSITYSNSSNNPGTATRTVSFRVTDQHAANSNTDTRDVTVAGANDAPVVTTTGGSVSYSEGDPATVIDGGATVADTDDTNIESAQVRVSSGFQSGDVLAFANTASITGNYNSGTGVLTLTGTDTVANYQAALRAITYNHTGDNPGSGKTVEFKVNDGDTDSNAATRAINITGVNDAPTVTTSGGSASFTEGGTAPAVDPSVTVTDPDSATLSGATVSITSNFSSADGDTLNFVNTANIGGVYNSGTGILTLSGTDTVANYQAALRSITFSNTSDNPSTATRTVSFRVDDGGGVNNLSNVATRDVTVARSNDASVVTLSSGSTGYSEGGAAVPVDNGLTVTDADDTNIESAQVRVASGFESGDVLSFTNTATITGNYASGTGVLTLTGTDSVANYQAALRAITYDHTGNDPHTPKGIEFKVNDGDADSNTPTKTIDITGVNDGPVLDVTNANLSYTEGDGAVAVDNALTLDDPENDQISGATVQITSGFQSAEDALAFVNTANITGNYNSGTGVLTLTGSDTEANYQAALRSVTYANSSQNPNTAARLISFQATDAGLPAEQSNIDTRTVNVAGANDAPVVTPTNGSTPYTEGDPNTTVDGGVTVTDVDDTNIESAQVRISSGFQTGDSLGMDPNPQNGITAVYNSGTGILTLTGSATVAQYQSALQDVFFVSTNPSPVTSKTVEFKVNDGDSDSNAPTKEITVTPVNSAPIVNNSNPNLSYAENDPATQVDTGVTVSDPENDSISGASASITANYQAGQDFLSWTDNNLADNITLDNINSSDQTVVLTGVALATDYQAALRDVEYANSSENPSSLTRTVTFSATDVPGATGSDTRGITVTNLDDPPDAVNDSATVLEDAAATSIPVLTNDTDIDGGPKTISSATDPANGTVVLTGGSPGAHTGLTYQPDPNYCNDPPGTTPDTFNYTVNGGDSATVSMTVTCVNDAPVADDETFNGNDSAHGNTTLQVDDPDDDKSAPTNPHTEITGDILAGDTDVDGPGPLTVTPGTFATNDGGSVTLESDGDFVFQPAASTSCTDTSDFFDYTVEDSGSPEQTDTGRVTIAIAGCVWYVNNNSPGNSGTSTAPFDTLAQAETASGNNHTVFVFDGDNTSTGYNTGFQMNSGERLIGEHEGLVVDPDQGGSLTADTLYPANAGAHPTLTGTNEDVVALDDGNEVRGFNIDPAGTGGGIAGASGDTGGATIDDVNIVDTGTAGQQPMLELDSTTGTFNFTNLVVDNSAATSPPSTAIGVKLNNAGTVNFLNTGLAQISIKTNGAKGLDAVSTNMGTSVIDDITVTGSGSGGVNMSSTTGSTTLGDNSGSDLDLTTTSGATAAFGLSNAGTISVGSGGTKDDVHATGGPAIDVSGTSGATLDFDDVDSTNSANDGINLDGLGTGTFSATSGDIGGAAGIGFDLNGGSGAITYPGTFSNGSGPLVSEITGRSGGVVSVSGNLNDTNDAGGGVSVTGNTGGSTVFSGATKQFNTGASDAITFGSSDGHTLVFSGGGTDIDTTSGNGVNATTSGTFQVSGSGNTLDSTALGASNRGLNISDTDIAAADATFQRISTSGGTNGIRLNSTGSVGGLFVTGVGGTCTSVDQTGCSGGVIQSATGAGVELTTVGNEVSLTRVNVKNGGDDGIRATTVGSSGANGIALLNSVISSNGNANGESGLDWTNVNGTTAITNDAFSSNFDFNAQLTGTSGTLNLTVQSSTFTSAGVDDGLQLISNGTSTMNSTIGGAGVGNTFTNNKGDAIDMGATAAAPSSVSNTTISNNTITGAAATALDGGIAWSPDGNAKVHVNNNNIQNVSATALSVQSGGAGAASATTDATVNNNVIGTAAQVNSGSDDGDGIQVLSPGDGTSKFLVKDNNIHGFDKNGMKLRGSESTNGADTDITAQGNTIDSPDTTHAETGILLQSGSLSADVVDVCADVGGAGALANTFSGALNFGGPGIGNFWLSLRFANSKMKAPGYVGTTLTDRQNYFLGRNSGFSGGAAPYVEDGAQNLTTPSPANCLQPTLPSTG